MVWDHVGTTKPHLVYILLGAFTTIFMLVSSFIKERMFIGEATVATIFGVIFGPHAANLINPLSWGSVDIVTIEFSRIVLVVQCFAIGVELPKFYMERHWRSVVYLLLPVMAAGWLLVSVVVWWMVPRLSWLESLVVAACVTATDPVLASSVVGKGKFAQRVPKHLRDLLSAESGCNDGMAFPFVYLALYLILYNNDAKEVTFHWFLFTILYECVFGALFGFFVGYLARHGIKWAHEHDMIDRESFLVFYFVVALFCAGSGSILGVDDLLVGFAAGVGFSNDGWFGEKTEESHVSNVIDLLLNLTYFVFLGTIIPWEMYNDAALGLSAWRLSVLAIFVILFRRIPVMLALKPLIPELKNWREALFAGHFGPIGVGAIFVALLARAELEHHDPVPMSELPDPGVPHYTLIVLVWPIVTFLVISSMIVHGSSVAVFTLGKRITTLPITISFTQANEDGPTWMNRLPRIASMRSQGKSAVSDTEGDDLRMPEIPPGAMPPVGMPYNFLRRQKEEEAAGGGSRPQSRASSLLARRRKKKWDDGIGPGGPVSQSAIMPARRSTNLSEKDRSQSRPRREDTDGARTASTARGRRAEAGDPEKDNNRSTGNDDSQSPTPPRAEVFAEGDHVIVENEDGDVIATEDGPERPSAAGAASHAEGKQPAAAGEQFQWTLAGFRKKVGDVYASEVLKRKEKDRSGRHQEFARAYQFGNTIIVEDRDGEVVKTYELPAQRPGSKTSHEGGHGTDMISQSLKLMGLGGFGVSGGSSSAAAAAAPGSLSAAGNTGAQATGATGAASPDNEEDKNIRFKIGGVGQRMTSQAFIEEMRKLDTRTRREVVDQSNAPQGVKKLAREGDDRREEVPDSDSDEPPRGRSATVSSTAPPVVAPHHHHHLQKTSSAGSGARPAHVDDAETPAERRRRMSVLAGQSDEGGETAAERRRRIAALRADSAGDEDGSGESESDSEEDDQGRERAPPAAATAAAAAGAAAASPSGAVRRGIRFADAPARG